MLFKIEEDETTKYLCSQPPSTQLCYIVGCLEYAVEQKPNHSLIQLVVELVEHSKIPSWIPAIIIMREFIVSGYRLIAVEKKGEVVAASIWGKLKTVTQMIAIILAFIDTNPFGAIFTNSLTGYNFAINLIVTLMMIICVIATIFSGWDYIKNGKDLLK